MSKKFNLNDLPDLAIDEYGGNITIRVSKEIQAKIDQLKGMKKKVQPLYRMAIERALDEVLQQSKAS
jgi:hypothetical protein